MTDHTDIVERLNNTPNWMRESYGSWKDCVLTYDRAPFEAAAEITRLREDNKKLSDKAEALRKALAAIVDRDFTFFDGCVDRNTITYGEIQQARSALDATKGTT